jgi:hypothetical protein
MDLKLGHPAAEASTGWHRVHGMLRKASANLTDVQESLDAAFHGEAKLSTREQQAILTRLEEAHEAIIEILSTPLGEP